MKRKQCELNQLNRITGEPSTDQCWSRRLSPGLHRAPSGCSLNSLRCFRGFVRDRACAPGGLGRCATCLPAETDAPLPSGRSVPCWCGPSAPKDELRVLPEDVGWLAISSLILRSARSWFCTGADLASSSLSCTHLE